MIRINFIEVVSRPAVTDMRELPPLEPFLPDGAECPCTRCHLERCELPVGSYEFEWDGIPMTFPTHHERLIIVGLHSRCILRVVDGTKTGICYNTDDVLRFARYEPVAILHNHPDDFPEIDGVHRNEPSDVDCEAAAMLDMLTRLHGLHPITHVVVTRDSGYATFNRRGIVKQGGMPCSPTSTFAY